MSGSVPWTVRQEEVLRAYGHMGARAVQGMLLHECGVARTLRAIEMHASRMHVSLRRLEQCPECGALGVRLSRQSGLCMRCTEFLHVEEERAFHELLLLEAAGCDEGSEIDAARREYARLRQANSRLMRKHGLKGKRERDDYLGLGR